MALTAEERRIKAIKITQDLFAEAQRLEDRQPGIVLSDDLVQTFQSTTISYREVILTAIVARLIDSSFHPRIDDFYNSHPRSVYERAIRLELQQRKIKCSKSGPLNIAKAASRLSEEWATRRGDPKGALATVRIVDSLNDLTEVELLAYGALVCVGLLRIAHETSLLHVDMHPEADPQRLITACLSLIEAAPDAGNTAQRVVGYLLESYHEALHTGIEVTGHLEGASSTNTTSKKPGDIIESLPDQARAVLVYEVTTKIFDEQRVDDSRQAVIAYATQTGEPVHEVFVVCHKRDIRNLTLTPGHSSLYLGKLEQGGITYHFMEMNDWVVAQLLRMPEDSRLAFNDRLSAYVNDFNTASSVKRAWGTIVSTLAVGEESTQPESG